MEQDINDFRELFSKLGLNYDIDVPPPIKEQLKVDKNAKNILQDLGRELEESGDIQNLKKYLGANDEPIPSPPVPMKKSCSTVEIRRKPKITSYKFDTSLESMKYHPSTQFSVKPGEPCLITILNEPIKKHQNHPINLFLKQANEFCYMTMLKAVSFRGSSKAAPQFDAIGIQTLSKLLKIDIPKLQNAEMQTLFKSKQFIVACKGIIL
jgi:hypothetical protein